jgi:hypothetical protein
MNLRPFVRVRKEDETRGLVAASMPSPNRWSRPPFTRSVRRSSRDVVAGVSAANWCARPARRARRAGRGPPGRPAFVRARPAPTCPPGDGSRCGSAAATPRGPCCQRRSRPGGNCPRRPAARAAPPALWSRSSSRRGAGSRRSRCRTGTTRRDTATAPSRRRRRRRRSRTRADRSPAAASRSDSPRADTRAGSCRDV